MGLTITGIDALTRRLSQIASHYPDEAAAALHAEAEAQMVEAKARTPVLTGALRDSGVVSAPTFTGNEIAVTLSFGDGLDYAIAVHEDLQARREDGQPKFLETAVLESAAELPERVAQRLARLFEG